MVHGERVKRRPNKHINLPNNCARGTKINMQRPRNTIVCGPAALRTELMAFRKVNAWVEESALFYALTQAPGTSMMAWWDWPEDLRLRCALAPSR